MAREKFGPVSDAAPVGLPTMEEVDRQLAAPTHPSSTPEADTSRGLQTLARLHVTQELGERGLREAVQWSMNLRF